jgi:hypothetical protein
MAAPPPRLIQELYAFPPGDFTRERNARAAALVKAGHADQARALKQLRKPTASLWAVNQLAREEPTRLAALVEAVGHARAAQLRDPRAAGEALRRQRTELDALVEKAGEVLSGQGHRLTPALSRRIADTLLGAAVDRRLADDLRHGRLLAELPAPGFEIFSAVSGAGRLRVLPGGKTEREKAETAESARQARAQTAEEERQRRRREAEALDREAAAREAAAREVERKAAEAAAALAESRRRLQEARRQAKAAAAAARKARRSSR